MCSSCGKSKPKQKVRSTSKPYAKQVNRPNPFGTPKVRLSFSSRSR